MSQPDETPRRERGGLPTGHWHLRVVPKAGITELWCGDSFAEVCRALSQYADPLNIEAHPLLNGRGGLCSQWCARATRMPGAEDQ